MAVDAGVVEGLEGGCPSLELPLYLFDGHLGAGTCPDAFAHASATCTGLLAPFHPPHPLQVSGSGRLIKGHI